MLTISGLRDKYGDTYITAISDDIIIPFRPLSLFDFYQYEDKLREGIISQAVLEDEIFIKCVLSKEYIQNINTLPAGTVTTTVQNIMEVSGPTGIGQFNSILEEKRNLIANPIHQLVILILRAFPAYKPEDIYTMSYDMFMLRLAQAEDVLMKAQIIREPIELLDPTIQQKKKPKVILDELKHLWEKQQPVEPSEQSINRQSMVGTPQKESPIFADGGIKTQKNLFKEKKKVEDAVGSEDEDGLRDIMVKQALEHYAPVIKKLEQSKK